MRFLPSATWCNSSWTPTSPAFQLRCRHMRLHAASDSTGASVVIWFVVCRCMQNWYALSKVESGNQFQEELPPSKAKTTESNERIPKLLSTIGISTWGDKSQLFELWKILTASFLESETPAEHSRTHRLETACCIEELPGHSGNTKSQVQNLSSAALFSTISSCSFLDLSMTWSSFTFLCIWMERLLISTILYMIWVRHWWVEFSTVMLTDDNKIGQNSRHGSETSASKLF